MRIDVLTLFPQMVRAAASYSILQRAMDAGIVVVNVVDIRDYARGRHRITDDTPCGGGGGMVMKVDPIAYALDGLANEGPLGKVVLTDPRGRQFTQVMAREFAAEDRLVLVCGHYEGVDERVREHLVTDTVSIGDYILTGGELPALVVLDAVVRLLPGALGDEAAPDKDTLSDGLLEYPQYTRPRSFRGWDVPEVLFSGHHAELSKWRRTRQLVATRRDRPDLWARFEPTGADRILMAAADERADVARELDPRAGVVSHSVSNEGEIREHDNS